MLKKMVPFRPSRLEGDLKEASRRLQGGFKGASRRLQEGFKGLQGGRHTQKHRHTHTQTQTQTQTHGHTHTLIFEVCIDLRENCWNVFAVTAFKSNPESLNRALPDNLLVRVPGVPSVKGVSPRNFGFKQPASWSFDTCWNLRKQKRSCKR